MSASRWVTRAGSRLSAISAASVSAMPIRRSASANSLRARILAIACGYEDADDLDHLRRDPALKLACGHLPDSGRDLCSQPTVSRTENTPGLREVIKLMRAMVALYCRSYPKPPEAVTLDIDDTLDVVHGHQQLSLFNAHYDERCFLPIHVYDTATSRPVAVLLRPGKTPSGREVRGHLRRLLREIRRHWPRTHITIRGDSHYGRPEVHPEEGHGSSLPALRRPRRSQGYGCRLCAPHDERHGQARGPHVQDDGHRSAGLVAWLASEGCTHVVMEATGVLL